MNTETDPLSTPLAGLEEPTVDPGTLDAKGIARWALTNKERARAIGKRIFTFQSDPDAILAEPSLGPYEDALTRWAVDNPRSARLLMLKLAPKLIG
jgi:hypothetical protein